MKKLARGALITFEGGEGAGKSTQIRLLKPYLEERGYPVLATYEPGGTAIGEKIRRILLDPAHDGMSPLAELFLYCASRAQHVGEIIAPALKTGAVVLCDRFTDSTLAYQSGARGIPRATIAGLNALATGGIVPSLTILLDCPPGIGLRRVRADNVGRFEMEGLAFHRKVRTAYLALARAGSRRYAVVDARQTVRDVQRDIRKAVDARLR